MRDVVPCGTAVVIFKIAGGQKRVLLGLRKGSHGAGEWAFPGGRIEPEEPPIVTASREVREETGINLWPEDLRLVERYPVDNGLAGDEPWVTVYYGATVHAEARAIAMEPHRCAGWRWFRRDELPTQDLFGPTARLLQSGALGRW